MRTLLFLILSSHLLSAQNLLVRFYPNNQPYQGLTNYPSEIRAVSFTTNAPGWNTNMTFAQYDLLRSASVPIYESGASNEAYTAELALKQNTDRLVQLYAGIPSARATINSFSNATNTMTTAQLTAATRQLAGYTEKLMEFIQRLGPVLKEMYKPEDDPVK